jgi:uncharacterized protein (DUF433 family)
MKLTTIIASATTAAVLATAGVAVAGAANTGSTSKPAAVATEMATKAGMRGVLHKFAKRGFVLAAKTIGITPKELAQEVKSGKTIAQVATEHGKNPQDVINAIVAAADKRIDDSTKLSADQKAKLEANVPAAVTKFVNSTRLGAALRQNLRAGLPQRLGRGAAKIAATTIGITPKELAQEVKSGKTIAQVATEHGKNPQDVTNAIVAAGNQRIQASTKLSADRKATLEAKLPTVVANFVNNWHPKQP